MCQDCLICDQSHARREIIDFLLRPVKYNQYDNNFINNYDHVKGGYYFQKTISMCSQCRDAWFNFDHDRIADGQNYNDCIDSMRCIIDEIIEKYL